MERGHKRHKSSSEVPVFNTGTFGFTEHAEQFHARRANMLPNSPRYASEGSQNSSGAANKNLAAAPGPTVQPLLFSRSYEIPKSPQYPFPLPPHDSLFSHQNQLTSFPLHQLSLSSQESANAPHDFRIPRLPRQPNQNFHRVLRPAHNANLSISSHLDMFSLDSVTHKPLYNFPQLPQRSSPPGSIHLQHQLLLYAPETDKAPLDKDAVLSTIMSQILEVDAINLNWFLLDVIYRVDPGLSLDDFYNVLYNYEGFKSLSGSADDGTKIDKTKYTNSQEIQDAIEIIHSVLDIFRSPELLLEHYPSIDISSLKIGAVNFHELLRSFLAIKVLHHALIQQSPSAEEPSTIPRVNIYKAYYILCQKLILRYPSASNSTSLQQKIILGQSKLGKLIKLVFPNLLSKRLGRRGKSKYNYLGLCWNSHVVNDEVIKLCEVDVDKLGEVFKIQKRPSDSLRSKSSTLRRHSSVHRPLLSQGHSDSLSLFLYENFPNQRVRASSSFINPNIFYPVHDFSMQFLLDDKPGQNNWYNEARAKSWQALEDEGFDAEGIRMLICEPSLVSEEFADSLDGLSDILFSWLTQIEPSDTNIHLHFFMVILLELLFVLFQKDRALDSQKQRKLALNTEKIFLRIKTEIKQLDAEIVEKFDINPFLGVLSRLLHVCQLLTSFFKTDIHTYILKEMQDDVIRVITSKITQDSLFEIHQLLVDTVFAVLTANNYLPQMRGVPLDVGGAEVVNDLVNVVESIVERDLTTFVESFMSNLRLDADKTFDGSTNDMQIDVVYAVLKIVDAILTEDIILRFPIMVVQQLYAGLTTQMLKFVYLTHMSMKDDNRPQGNPTFRLWYVLQSFIQEFLNILGELVALRHKLSE